MAIDRSRHLDLGLLLLRVGLGVMFMVHGWPKLGGGSELWTKLGGAMHHFGLHFGETWFGFAAAVSEFFGGLLVALGVLFRPACLLLVCTMIVAATLHLAQGDGIGGASHAIEAGIVFAALILIGPGRFSIDARGRK